MIYLDIAGRCGNQMFQYSFARKLSFLNDDQITIDFFLVDSNPEPSFRDELCNFEASNQYIKIVDGSNKIYKYGSKKQVFIFKVYTKIKRLLQKFCSDKRIANKLLYRIMSHYGIYWYISPLTIKRCKQKNKFVFGYFENPGYFDDIREILVKDFTPIKPIDYSSNQLYEKLNSTEAVCVSVRKWEEVSYMNTGFLEVCGKDYYKKSINYIKQRFPNALFVIFSNEVEWVRNNFDFLENCIFESGNDPIYEKVRLMSSCKHFIITNSTFAWWVQYLSQYDSKIVISPKQWRKTDKKRSPLIMDDFIVVE